MAIHVTMKVEFVPRWWRRLLPPPALLCGPIALVACTLPWCRPLVGAIYNRIVWVYARSMRMRLVRLAVARPSDLDGYAA